MNLNCNCDIYFVIFCIMQVVVCSNIEKSTVMVFVVALLRKGLIDFNDIFFLYI